MKKSSDALPETVFPELYAFVRQFHPIDGPTFHLLTSHFTARTFHKGDYLVEEGQTQKELFFVHKGVQMSFFVHEGKQHIIAFAYPPNIVAIPESFTLQKPSQYYLQCLTKSEFNCISFNRLQQLFDQSQPLERLFRKITETILAGLIQRHIELQTLPIEDRFKAFAARSPQLLQMIPHKYIASYLNIDPTNFSKLYNSVKI